MRVYTDRRRDQPPPAFLRLAGHPQRWRLLRELARGDRRVRELADLLGLRQSLVSYHLGRLRAAGIVSLRRSSADGRDAYCSIDLRRCGVLLAAAGEALHPGLRMRPDPEPRKAEPLARPRVLFLCTGNSARSQMAEALTNRLGAGRLVACSAGSHPKALHPNAVRVMAARSIDISSNRVKHVDEFAGQPFDFVITLCDRVRERCPEFPGDPRRIHWSLPDPASEVGSDDAVYAAFERTADEVESRIRFLLTTVGRERDEQEVEIHV